MLYEHLTLDTITSAGVATVLVDLVNGPQYQNARYTRAVAARRASSLAGQSPYAEVEDEITVDVLGATYGACVRNAERLWGVIDQAAEWEAGINTTAIQLRLKAPCSEVGELTTMVLGPAAGTAPGEFAPSQDVAAAGSPWVLRDVAIRFRTRGRLLDERDSSSQVDSSGNPTVETLTFTADQGRIYAPVGFAITSQGEDFVSDDLYSFLLVASAANAIQLFDATAGTAIAPFSDVNDAGDFPYNGTNVHRYTPAGTAGNSTTFAASATLYGYEQFAVLACVRNNSASVPFLLRLDMTQINGADDITTRGAMAVVEAGYTDPQYISLGTISIRGTSNTPDVSLSLFCQATSISGSPTLDISHIALLALDAPSAGILAVANTVNGQGIHVLPAEVLNAARSGIVGSGGTVFDNAVPGNPYRGDIELQQQGSNIYVSYLRTQGQEWTVVDTGTPAKANIRFQAHRRRSYLTPQ